MKPPLMIVGGDVVEDNEEQMGLGGSPQTPPIEVTCEHLPTRRRGVSDKSTTGVRGVCPSLLYKGLFMAQIYVNGQTRNLGQKFATIADAEAAYLAAEKQLKGAPLSCRVCSKEWNVKEGAQSLFNERGCPDCVRWTATESSQPLILATKRKRAKVNYDDYNTDTNTNTNSNRNVLHSSAESVVSSTMPLMRSNDNDNAMTAAPTPIRDLHGDLSGGGKRTKTNSSSIDEFIDDNYDEIGWFAPSSVSALVATEAIVNGSWPVVTPPIASSLTQGQLPRGVVRSGQKFQATTITASGMTRRLGYFLTVEQAAAAVEEAECAAATKINGDGNRSSTTSSSQTTLGGGASGSVGSYNNNTYKRYPDRLNATKPNATGYKGVGKHGNRFQAQIKFDGKRLYIGYYKTAEEASQAFAEAEVRLKGHTFTCSIPSCKRGWFVKRKSVFA